MSKHTLRFSIVGGDMRQSYLAFLLQQQGYSVTCYRTPALPFSFPYTTANSLQETLQHANIIIGGLPLSKGDLLSVPPSSQSQSPIHLAEFLTCLHSGQILIGGLLPPCVLSYCKECNITCLDFMHDDSFAIYNTTATAEGCLAEAILRHPSNLQDSHCLVLGYGKCAKILSEKLKALHAHTTICARKSQDRAFACARGLKAISFADLPDYIHHYSYIFNTVPDMVLPDSLLQKVQPDVLIIDIASAPGGVDYIAAGELKIQTCSCLGLPGRYAPKSSAEGMLAFLQNHITIYEQE